MPAKLVMSVQVCYVCETGAATAAAAAAAAAAAVAAATAIVVYIHALTHANKVQTYT